MKIDRAQWQWVSTPLNIVANLFSPREICTVHVRLSSGELHGFGYVYCWHSGAAEALLSLGNMMSPKIIGTSLEDWQDTSAGLTREFVNFLGTEGMAAFIHSALDVAVWDVTLKHRSLTLQQAVNRPQRPAACYTSRDLWPNLTPAECHRRAEELIQAGARGVKIWVSSVDMLVQRDRVFAVREALGADGDLYIDANQGFQPRQALEFAQLVAPARPQWLEDPVHKDDLDGLTWVADRSPVPIATGENAYGICGIKRLLDSANLQTLLIDLQRIGGISGWNCAVALACAQGIRVSSHLFPEIGARLLCGCRSAEAVVEVSSFLDSLFEQLPMMNGTIAPPCSSGASLTPRGIAWSD
jgi:mandelate racemase